MKHKLLATVSALFLAVSAPAYSQSNGHAEHDMGAMSHGAHEEAKIQNSVKLELKPTSAFTVDETTQVTLKLANAADGKPISLDDLKEAHTKKLHLLVIDPSLTDYHHIHPVAGKNAGEFVFDFMPKKNDSYRVWADVIPVATGKQEYVMADMGSAAKDKAAINKATSMTSTVDGYTFTLALDSEPKAGSAVMGNITVTKDGKPFTQLEPVMGAFAHVVGFTEDYNSVMHIHPMGKEPTSDSERGGPKLEFHIEPEKAGFVKMFAQVKIGGKDVFVPFGITVK